MGEPLLVSDRTSSGHDAKQYWSILVTSTGHFVDQYWFTQRPPKGGILSYAFSRTEYRVSEANKRSLPHPVQLWHEAGERYDFLRAVRGLFRQLDALS